MYVYAISIIKANKKRVAREYSFRISRSRRHKYTNDDMHAYICETRDFPTACACMSALSLCCVCCRVLSCRFRRFTSSRAKPLLTASPVVFHLPPTNKTVARAMMRIVVYITHLVIIITSTNMHTRSRDDSKVLCVGSRDIFPCCFLDLSLCLSLSD